MESTDGFGWRGRGRSFHIEGPKTEKAWGPIVESLVQGIWRPRASSRVERTKKVLTEIGRTLMTVPCIIF